MENLQAGTLYCTATLSKEENERICRQLPPYFRIEYLPEDGTNRIFTRRINIGSLCYKQDVISYHFSKRRKRWTHFEDFVAELTNITNFDSGIQDFYCHNRHRFVGISGFSKKKRNIKKCKICVLSENGIEYIPTEIDTLQFSCPESQKIESERQESLDNIRKLIIDHITRFHQLPTTEEIHQVIGENVLIGIPMSGENIPKNTYYIPSISKLVIDKNLDIILPEYNDKKIPLEPQQKAVYILFLKHGKNGIFLSKMAEYKTELENIYSTLMPQKNEKLIEEFVKDICQPSSKRLQQNISKINATFRKYLLNPDISTKYCITGKRQHSYGIHLNEVELPKFFK